ncbi:TPA: phosphate acyltransferase PlsX [Candidatus Poribacteria bacterium]|nr:phosphate acyltransferase PlsX [Candidatus Poribacteria bacterium]
MRIAVDAMGGDNAPGVVVEGSILAAREYPFEILLVGPQAILEGYLKNYNIGKEKISLINATQYVLMDEIPADAVRKKRDSSMHVCARLIKSGRADAMVTAGNTAAALAISRSILGKLKGVSRPALASIIPNMNDATILLDVGANAGSCMPEHLLEFALMGDIYSREVLGKDKPRIGLLSVGEERTKGSSITKEALPLLEKAPINFIGNVEGKEIVNGGADVVVCDGFVGNAILKFAEGASVMFFHVIKTEINRSLSAKIGMLLAKKALKAFTKKLDYENYGGAPILGINGACIIGHGKSSANAIKSAIRVASEFVSRDVNKSIEKSLLEMKQKIDIQLLSNEEE